MGDDDNDDKDDGDLRPSFSHTVFPAFFTPSSPLPSLYPFDDHPLPPAPSLPPKSSGISAASKPNFSFSLSGKPSGESGMGFPS